MKITSRHRRAKACVVVVELNLLQTIYVRIQSYQLLFQQRPAVFPSECTIISPELLESCKTGRDLSDAVVQAFSKHLSTAKNDRKIYLKCPYK